MKSFLKVIYRTLFKPEKLHLTSLASNPNGPKEVRGSKTKPGPPS